MNEVCGEILADTGRLISSDRAEQHGDMRANHENIANLWGGYGKRIICRSCFGPHIA